MGKTLLIVESPNKVKKVQKYAGAGFKVMASVGHIRDMPEHETGVSAPEYRPTYEVTNQRVVTLLKEAASECDGVLLATDPDREGEAIAWHLAQVLKLKEPQRVLFNEINEKAVKAALENVQPLDVLMVAAQEARRVLDRLVGYRVSPALSDIAGEALSAGRVQSPAVRLVVEREEAIEQFKPTKHYGAMLTFKSGEVEWPASWDFKPLLADPEGSPYWMDKAFAERVGTARTVKVQTITEKEVKRGPRAPFTTSTMQQAASSRAKIRSKAAMDAAQKLFEGDDQGGLITYHRTDSPNLSDEGAEMVWTELRRQGLDDYIIDKRRTWKAKEGAQEGHEACRPTDFGPESFERVAKHFGEASNEAKLYRLIWEQAMASQMADKRDFKTEVMLTDAEGIDGRELVFTATGTVPVFDGWMRISQPAKDDDDDSEEPGAATLPQLQEGMTLTAERGELVEKSTKAPPRYTEASLVKALEDMGIGRPSTFASIIENITTKRGYVVADKQGRLSPSPTAREKVVKILRGRFAFADLEFTRKVEELFDQIAEGKAKYKQVVTLVDNQLTGELEKLVADGLLIVHDCPDCGSPLRRRKGKKDHFWGCSNYPACEATFPDDNGAPGERPAPYDGPAYPCPVCGRDMIPKSGKSGTFWACTGYPECTAMLNDDDGKPAVAYHCPEEGCKGLLRKFRAKKGKNRGKAFWSCSDKSCEFTAKDDAGNPEGVSA